MESSKWGKESSLIPTNVLVVRAVWNYVPKFLHLMKPKKKLKLFFPKAALKIALKKPWKPVRWNVSIGKTTERS